MKPERGLARLRLGGAGQGRPRGGALGQVALVVGAWFAYSMARSLSGNDAAEAIKRGRDLQDWDQWLGFGWTQGFNHWITARDLFAIPLSVEYASLHYVVTPLVLVWLWRRHPGDYRPALVALMTMSMIGLIVYIGIPVAPPRLLPGAGWIDTMSTTSDFGWWGGAASAPAGLGNYTDQFAAMPSLHVGWAVWCAWVWTRVGGRVARRTAWLYPALVAVTVVATANHYVLDVAVGALLSLTACLLLPRWLDRRQADRAQLDPQARDRDQSGRDRSEGQNGRGQAPSLTGVTVIDLRDQPRNQLVRRVDEVSGLHRTGGIGR